MTYTYFIIFFNNWALYVMDDNMNEQQKYYLLPKRYSEINNASSV